MRKAWARSAWARSSRRGGVLEAVVNVAPLATSASAQENRFPIVGSSGSSDTRTSPNARRRTSRSVTLSSTTRRAGTTTVLDAATTASAPPVQTLDPYAPPTAHRPDLRYYERLIAWWKTGASAPSPHTGPPVNGVGTTSSTPTALSEAGQAMSLSITTAWYPGPRGGGRRQ
jgi:hypothetical protein